MVTTTSESISDTGRRQQMEIKLKPISRVGIASAISKAELYRYLNEPGEAESICQDILAVEPTHQTALRLLGLAITDQFTGTVSDRYAEAAGAFNNLTSDYRSEERRVG